MNPRYMISDICRTDTTISKLLLFLAGVLGLTLAKLNILFILIFVLCYFFLVYCTFSSKSILGLILCGILSSLVLALRFKYLTWGDPWYEYAMILNIMNTGMLSPASYPSQQPTLHALIAATATYTKIEAMQLQKFIIPALSCISILTIYRFSKEFFDEETAITSALLLSVGTAYIHWTSQAVRESLGIPLCILAFYISYKSLRDAKYLPAAALLIAGLVLTHHLSMLIFLVWWNSFALAYIYLISEEKKEAIIGLLISIFSFAIALFWWKTRLGFTYNTVSNSANSLFHTNHALQYIFIMIIMLFIIPELVPKAIKRCRSVINKVLQFETAIFFGIVLLALICAGFALNFLLGRSFFVLSYKPLFFANGLIMLSLAVAGLRSMLSLDKIPILTWAGGVAIMLIGSMIGLYAAVDPLRFIEFIYLPLSIISAAGFTYIFRNFKHQIRAAILALICLLSLIAAFPSTVLWDEYYPSFDPRYDTRALVISHPESEIMAIDVLEDYGAKGRLYTDTYVGYASMHLENVSVNYYQRPNPETISGDDSFLLLTKRMTEYAEFGEWLLKEKSPLGKDELKRIDEKTSRIYDNGDSWIYRG